MESHHVVSDPSLEIAVAHLPIRGPQSAEIPNEEVSLFHTILGSIIVWNLPFFCHLQTDSEAPDKEGHSEGGTVDMESDVIVSDPALQVASDAPETSGIGGDNVRLIYFNFILYSYGIIVWNKLT